MLTAYRRHLPDCPHKPKGQKYTLCGCPIWVYGEVNGQQIRQSLRTSESTTALKRIEAMNRGEIETSTPAVEKAVALYLRACKARNIKESSLDSYQKTLDHLIKHSGKMLVNRVDAVTLDAFRASRRIAASTWRKELEHLRAFFAFCGERGWCQTNPARKLRMPVQEELQTLPFEAGEITKLLDATRQIFSTDPDRTAFVQERARALVYTLLYSGLRISDVAQLERSALDRKTGHLTLRVLKTGVRQKVLLHPKAASALNSLPARNPKYFFWTGRGDVITCIKNMRRTIQRLGLLAKVHAHPHRFRDTFAVELLTQGADIRTVQQLLGHKSVRTTEKHYAHFVAAHQRLLDSAAATLDFERPATAGPVLLAKDKRRGNRK